jgi:hypothetical protein
MDFKATNALLLARGLEFCQWLLPEGRQAGDEWVCGSLDGEEGSSLSVNMRTGRWKDFAEADDVGGNDLISLAAAIHNYNMGRAKRLCETEFLKGATQKQRKPEDDWWRHVIPDKTWTYYNKDGSVYCSISRWNAQPENDRAKVIRPWNPRLHNGLGDWKLPKKEPRPLLNLPEIANREGPVVLVAGEKCADAVAELGYIATTLLGGESSLSKTDLSPLAERDVILWADNDDAGHKWLERLKDALREAGVSSVRLVAVPDDAPPKWDAADAPIETRKALIDGARDSAPVVSGLVYFRADEITAEPLPPRQWLIGGAIPLGKLAVVYGAGGCGKSLAILDLGLKVATRAQYELECPHTFLGPVAPEGAGPVIFLTLEDDRLELQRRLENIDPERTHEGAPYFIIPGLDLEGFDPTLLKQEGRAVQLTKLAKVGIPRMIERITRDTGQPPRVLALDPAGDLLEGSEDDAAVVKPLMFYLRALAARFNIVILLVAHTAKGQADAETIKTRGVRGSGSWTQNARISFGLWRPTSVYGAKLLKDLKYESTPENLARIVCGIMGKENVGGINMGRRVYLQDEKTGLIHDATMAMPTKEDRIADEAQLIEQVIEGVRVAAEQGMPFCVGGKDHGGHTQRERFPPGPLRRETEVNKAWVEIALANLKNEGKIVSVTRWHSRKHCLDVPKGPVVTNDPRVTERNNWPYPYEQEADENEPEG